MRYHDLPLLSLVCALSAGCSDSASDGTCEPANVVDDADEPIERGAVGGAGTAEARLAVARDFVEAVLIDHDPAATSRFLSASAAPPAGHDEWVYHSLARVSVDGDWVLAESEASRDGVAQLAYDRFRVQGGRIVEHRRGAIVEHRRARGTR